MSASRRTRSDGHKVSLVSPSCETVTKQSRGEEVNARTFMAGKSTQYALQSVKPLAAAVRRVVECAAKHNP